MRGPAHACVSHVDLSHVQSSMRSSEVSRSFAGAMRGLETVESNKLKNLGASCMLRPRTCPGYISLLPPASRSLAKSGPRPPIGFNVFCTGAVSTPAGFNVNHSATNFRASSNRPVSEALRASRSAPKPIRDGIARNIIMSLCDNWYAIFSFVLQ